MASTTSPPQLTAGAVLHMVEEMSMADIQQQQHAAADYKPILQVTQVKMVSEGRYRAVLSDGTHFVQGMLATQLNPLVIGSGNSNHNGSPRLETNCIIRLERFMRNLVQGKALIILLDAVVLQDAASAGGSMIGDPMDIERVRNKQTGMGGSGSGSGRSGGVAAASTAEQARPLYNSTNHSGGATNPYGGGGGGGGSSGTPPYGGGGSSGTPYGGGASTATASGNPYGTGNNPYGGGTGRSRHQHQQHSHAAIVEDTTTGQRITPISALNIYNAKWTIKARVTSKSDIRTWSNAKGEGSLFSIELLDKSGMDIRATFFRDAVDKFYPFLQVGQVYRLTGGRLKVANQQYNTCKAPFEITFDANAEIHLDQDNDGSIQRQSYQFCKIADLAQQEAGKNVDILAIVTTVGDVANLISKKSGQELTKCDVVLQDDSQTAVTLTVWRDQAHEAAQWAGQVIAIRRARVSEYGGGKSLSGASSIEVNPPEGSTLQQWWQQTGAANAAAGGTVTNLSGNMGSAGGGMMGRYPTMQERKTIASIKQDNLGLSGSDKPDYLAFQATLTFLKKDKEGGAWYPACPNADEPCKNRYKVTQTTDGQWHCDKCQGTFDHCVRRWIFSGVVEDGTSSTWVSIFDDQARVLLQGLTADEAYQTTFENGAQDIDAYNALFQPAEYSEWIFKCKVKNEFVNEESRIKTSVANMWPVDYVADSQEMLSVLEKMAI